MEPIHQTGSGVAFEGKGILKGFNYYAGTTAGTFKVYDGSDNTGRALMLGAAVANDSKSDFDDEGAPFVTGLYIETTGGLSSEIILFRK